jgi:orotidine-5'-phosphate decarboxylase
MNHDAGIAIAFDVRPSPTRSALDDRLGPGPELAKVGLELFAAEGPRAVHRAQERGRGVFLDLKLHDIPNTVQGARRRPRRGLGAELLTVHATGGRAMIAAAVEGIRSAGGSTKVVAVTILTSLDATSVPPGFEQPFVTDAWSRACSRSPRKRRRRHRVRADRPRGRPPPPRTVRFFAVTPGIRPAGGATQDQARVSTITDAVAGRGRPDRARPRGHRGVGPGRRARRRPRERDAALADRSAGLTARES